MTLKNIDEEIFGKKKSSSSTLFPSKINLAEYVGITPEEREQKIRESLGKILDGIAELRVFGFDHMTVESNSLGETKNGDIINTRVIFATQAHMDEEPAETVDLAFICMGDYQDYILGMTSVSHPNALPLDADVDARHNGNTIVLRY